MTHTAFPAPQLAASAPLALVLVLSGCATGSGAAPAQPGDAADDVEALEASMARLERRQLDHIQRQRELEAAVMELAEAVERLGGSRAGKVPAEAAERRQPTRPAPDVVYAVPIDGSPAHGPKDAAVTIVMATEFACPYCYRVKPTLDELRDEYGSDLRVVYKSFLVHPQQATTPALAACAAHKQARHEEMEPLIWERGFANNRDLSEDNMKAIARDIGLDMRRFEADMAGSACSEKLREDKQLMSRFGTRGTPQFFINGRPLSGARPIDHFRVVIDEELAKASERIEEGTAPADYYRTWILDKGKSSL